MELSALTLLPTLDSPALADARQRELDIPRSTAIQLGRSAVEAARAGDYVDAHGQHVDWSDAVRRAEVGKRSIPPDAVLAVPDQCRHPTTRVQVTNETTLGAAQRLVLAGHRPLALNFANGIEPGGGFLTGSRAQEETLCRSSALYATLVGDPMYAHHRSRTLPDSTDWVIYSPMVPVFRHDDGRALPKPWRLSVLTCAAPFAPAIGLARAGELLQARILRVFEVAASLGYDSLVLGAWGGGAFRNDNQRTAQDFRAALEGPFRRCFMEVVFAVADWSPERRFLTPYHEAFGGVPPVAP